MKIADRTLKAFISRSSIAALCLCIDARLTGDATWAL